MVQIIDGKIKGLNGTSPEIRIDEAIVFADRGRRGESFEDTIKAADRAFSGIIKV